jgi:aldehyde:ferredoxin oxidoreductase
VVKNIQKVINQDIIKLILLYNDIYMTTLSEVFYVCLVTTISGMILKLASLAYKSKCKECSVCCIKVIRDVELEEKETEFRINHKQGSSLEISSNEDIK